MAKSNQANPASLSMLLARTAAAPHTSARTLRRDAAAGHLHRVRAGVYASGAQWNAASHRRLELARIGAVVHTRRRWPVLSHESAAAVWGLARLGPAPLVVELADVRGTAPRSEHGVRWRRTPVDLDEVVEVNGFLVTGLVQTLVDLACSRPFLSSVIALDAGLGSILRTDAAVTACGVGRADVFGRLDADGRRRGTRGAQVAIEFADGRAESVGESLSRGQMHVLGHRDRAEQTPPGPARGRASAARRAFRGCTPATLTGAQ
ncbi:hypothetical protein ACFWN7_10835 [Agromyces sp. NPDC058484]|uniref:hypothetical protein n=1 Tax=Agromyces sp. NPDC058484 TaxID=3346524 RepID=UPI0036546095